MSLRDELLDHLRGGPASAYSLGQDTCHPMALVEMALSRLVASGHVRRIDNVYRVIDRPAPAVADSTPPTTTEEPIMSIECKKCGEKKPEGDMVISSGKPSRLCKTCFAGSLKGTHGAAKPKAPKPTRATAKVRTIKEVVRKHAAPPRLNGSPITAAIAALKLKRAALDQAIAALEGVAA